MSRKVADRNFKKIFIDANAFGVIEAFEIDGIYENSVNTNSFCDSSLFFLHIKPYLIRQLVICFLSLIL